MLKESKDINLYSELIHNLTVAELALEAYTRTCIEVNLSIITDLHNTNIGEINRFHNYIFHNHKNVVSTMQQQHGGMQQQYKSTLILIAPSSQIRKALSNIPDNIIPKFLGMERFNEFKKSIIRREFSVNPFNKNSVMPYYQLMENINHENSENS